VDIENAGKPISAEFGHLAGLCDMVITHPDQDDPADGSDVVFCATPDRVGMVLAGKYVKAGVRVVDYSGDFRFGDTETYAGYAGRIGKDPKHLAPELLPKSIYGLAELHRDKIKTATVVGNPGCFAVSVILGMTPAVKAGAVDTGTLIADAKTGVSGAGKKPAATFHYPLRYDNMNAYKVAAHQHSYEVNRQLSLKAGKDLNVCLITQVVPVCRGIMTTCYGKVNAGFADAAKLVKLYRDTYAGEPFVRVIGPEGSTNSVAVRGTNFCNVWVNFDKGTGTLVVVSHIDNLMKGQAGNALQNMNIMFGLPETSGLMRPPQFP
jgi:N-acetyl-gamma-glutamyl-phosphate reductase